MSEFKNGDRVRCIDVFSWYAELGIEQGKVYTAKINAADQLLLLESTAPVHSFNPTNFELVKEEVSNKEAFIAGFDRAWNHFRFTKATQFTVDTDFRLWEESLKKPAPKKMTVAEIETLIGFPVEVVKE